MTLEISVRDYRGIERADIDLSKIALIAGKNEAGKTSLAEAVRAALTGTPIVVEGVTKKDAKYLVHDGADEGYVTVSNGDKPRKISWPKAQISGNEDAPQASMFAVGQKHLIDFAGRERAKLLAQYIDSEPALEDLSAAMSDLGYGDKAITQVWESIASEGWDGIYTRAREYTTELKGKWNAITGEKWGKRKSEGWTPQGWQEDLEGQSTEALHQNVVVAEAQLEETIARQAVDGAEKQRLEEEAGKLPHLKENHEQALADQSKARKDLDALKNSEPDVPERADMICPKCSAKLAMEKGQLVLKKNAAGETKVREALKVHEEWERDFKAGQDALTAANQRVQELGSLLQAAEKATEQLADINKQNSSATAEDVEKAREAVKVANDLHDAFQDWQKATNVHNEIRQNEELVGILAPEGLRQRKLADRLEDFNAGLKKLSESAGWPIVRLDEKLDVYYGVRPYWAASASAQWRVRAIIQCLMAQLDDSVAVILDEADILDTRGRNGLFAMLADLGQRALICMTINKPTLVPDLAEADMGSSYWVDAGVVREIGKETA